jgi:hypothetical protein
MAAKGDVPLLARARGELDAALVEVRAPAGVRNPNAKARSLRVSVNARLAQAVHGRCRELYSVFHARNSLCANLSHNRVAAPHTAAKGLQQKIV